MVLCPPDHGEQIAAGESRSQRATAARPICPALMNLLPRKFRAKVARPGIPSVIARRWLALERHISQLLIEAKQRNHFSQALQ